MQEKRKVWKKAAPFILTAIAWTSCFAILSFLLDLVIKKFFRGDNEALFSWLMLQSKELCVILLISWLIVGSAVLVLKIVARWKARAKTVESALQPGRGISK